MSLLCYLGRHRPSMQSIALGKHGGHVALCDGCGVPIERVDRAAWRATDRSEAMAHAKRASLRSPSP